MRISETNANIANKLRKLVQDGTETIGDGEGVAMLLLWGFLTDHALCRGVDVGTLARAQLEAYIQYAETNLKLVREH